MSELDTELAELTLDQVAQLIRERQVSPVELTASCLRRIERHGTAVNAFITVCADEALGAARAAEREIQQGGWRGPVHGLPIAVKDNIDTRGVRTTAGSAVFADRVPSEDAEVLRRLRQAGAVLLGKTNLFEFAAARGSLFGPTRNPWSLSHDTGGSSSGSAAAIAADFCFGALGTDTGGSIRWPAAVCGVVGLKPTYGLVSNRGALPSLDSLDHVGPICKTVRDVAHLLHVIAGYDPRWIGSVHHEIPDYARAIEADTRHFKVGVLGSSFLAGVDDDVMRLFNEALTVIGGIATIANRAVELPDIDLSFLASLKPEMIAFHAPFLKTAVDLYQPVLRATLMRDLLSLPSAIDYLNAKQQLAELRSTADDLFAGGLDVLVTPTFKTPPLTLQAIDDGWREEGLKFTDGLKSTVNTFPFSVLGQPAISVPCGVTPAGLPVGLQIATRPFAEAELLAFAHAFERASGWGGRKPDLVGSTAEISCGGTQSRRKTIPWNVRSRASSTR